MLVHGDQAPFSGEVWYLRGSPSLVEGVDAPPVSNVRRASIASVSR